MITECPNCKENLEGGLIYDTFIEKGETPETALRWANWYGATETEGRWGLAIAIYDMDRDRTVAWRCPHCNHEWKR